MSGRQLVRKCRIVVAVELHGDEVGRIRLRHVADASLRSLGEFVRDCVEEGSEVHTDGWSGYAGLERAGYRHQLTPTKGRRCNHASGIAPCPPSRRALEALVKGYVSRQRQFETPAVLSGRVHVSIQPSQVPPCGKNLRSIGGAIDFTPNQVQTQVTRICSSVV